VVNAPVWSRRLVGRVLAQTAGRRGVHSPGAAQVVTAPLIAASRVQVSLFAVLANLLVAEVIAPITLIGTTAAALSVCWARPPNC
jgi:competence protein ComEC